ncbi:phage tail assembly chaperone [Gallibacterium genomosp. 3]|uniref:phage tail assembly chaperone n=1 Tax=Gallibacterium genomosp. 3 TaxID=505345 RepID=UPI003B01E0C7
MITELLDYAKKEFELNCKPKGSEFTIKEHLEQVWEQTGIKPVELNNTLSNQLIAYLLDYFFELNLSRQMGMSINPLLYSEIEAWCRLSDICLDKWELDVIKQLDVIWLNVQSKNS